MEQNPHKYVTVAYELFSDNSNGIHELIEKAPVEHPFQFITGMGVALDSFEKNISTLSEGMKFDFTLPVDEAYGPYEEEHVIEIEKQAFFPDGHFDKQMVYPGAVLPLVNADGNRFDGLVLQVKEKTVVMDLNHPLAGKDLHFRGEVVTMRDATNEELQALVNMMSGEGGCGCGCEDCGGHGEGEGGCCGHGEGNGHREGSCCGHGEGHGHREGGCCGHGEGHGHREGGCCGHKH